MSALPLPSLARVIRSKNAGPTLLTLDILFNDTQGYELAAGSSGLSCQAVAERYGVDPAQVQRYLLPSILAIKFSLPRRLCAGDPGDGDVYGAQQHAPLLAVQL